MPPVVDAIFDLLAKLLIAAAAMAVIYRLLVGRRADAGPAETTNERPEPEPASLVVSGPFLDPVPALSTLPPPDDGAAELAADTAEAGSDADVEHGDDPGPLVTVASYQDVERAHLARLQLEQQGVPVFVADAGVVGMAWYYSNAVHGVKVQVPERYVERAYHVLATDERMVAPERADGGPGQAGEAVREPRCARCGSNEVYRVAKGRGVFFLLLLVLSLALPVVVRRYECDECGATYPRWPVEGAPA